MSGVEPFLASLFATAGTAGTSGAAAAGTAAASAATASGASLAGAAAAQSAAIAAATAPGLSTIGAIQLAAGAASVAGTTVELTKDKPAGPAATPRPPSHDDAQMEADMRSELYRRRGRAAALMSPGGARGDTSTPNLGSAALLGS